MEQLDKRLADIAREHLGIPTLESRLSDALDYHEVAVWSVLAALRATHEAGREAASPSRAEGPGCRCGPTGQSR